MKKVSFSGCLGFVRLAVFSLALVLFCGSAKAQILAEWPLVKKTVPPLGAFGPSFTATGVVPAAMVFTSAGTFGNPTTPANQGLKLKPANNLPWPTSPNPTDGTYSLDFPLSSVATPTNDLLLTGLTLVDSLPSLSSVAGTTISIAPYYRIDGAGAWIPLAAPQSFSLAATTDVNYGAINIPFYYNSYLKSGHTYDVRLYMYSTNGAAKGDYFYLNNVIINGTVQAATNVPTVTTGTPTSTGKYNGNGVGTYSYGATFQKPTMAGVTWSSSANPSIATSPFTTDGAGGVINSNITGLSANTLYHVRAYIVTPIDTLYGKDSTFKTDPYTAPVDTTSLPTNVLSNKATVGGVIIDSGGLPIKDKYIRYGTNSGSLTDTVRPTVNLGSAPYSVVLTQLLPSTKYYYEACVTNNQGTGCGNIDSFTTGVAVPTLSVQPQPPSIDFGDIIYNSTAPILSFSLNGKYLKAGTITISIAPASGFIISTSPTVFPPAPVSSITIQCGDGDFKKPIPIYVKFLTGTYGSFASTVSFSEDNNKIDPKNTDTVTITGNIIPSPDQLSNMGTDFWTGFAYENDMADAPTDGAAAQMSVYVAAGDKDAVVNIALPGIPGTVGYPQTVTILANTVKEFTGFPIGTIDALNSGNGPDARLYYTGISNRGVHITSTNGAPVAVWMHTYTTNNSAGATMVFPTNTWGSSYTVQGYGGITNSGKASSFFFVMAKEDSTKIDFTPSNDIVDSSKTTIFQEGNVPSDVLYAKGQTYRITLNKGEIFNAMAFVQGTGKNKAIGLDLSGTTVRAVDCSQKIAVFAGSGRVLVTTKTGFVDLGSDNLVQQMFPKVAWGTKYLTVPTKTMEYNVYRINVEDSTTKVWVNNAVHTAATALPISQYNSQGQYYPYESNQPSIIESDKPISLTQFIIAGSAPDGKDVAHPTIGDGGQGDPEEIILSPVQQAINSSTVYSSNFKNGKAGASYINVVIKNSGIASFKLDGKQTADTGISSYSTVGVPLVYGPAAKPSQTMQQIFKVHPGDPNYSWAMFRVASGPHTISSDVPFNAIAYGVNDGESYGYNAGTAINNLASVKISVNPYGYDTSSTVIKTCKNNKVTLKIALPYLPSLVDSIIWSAPVNSNINLSGSSVTGPYTVVSPNPLKVQADTSGSVIVGGQTFYIYTCPVQYQFKDNGFYPMVATAFGKFASECGQMDPEKIYVQVGTDNIDFKVTQQLCTQPIISITDNSTALFGTSITSWKWSLGDGTAVQTFYDSANHNPTPNPYTYPSLSAYTITLTTFNSVGCYSTDSLRINLANGINAGFTKDQDTICPSATVSFTDTSSITADSLVWNFGEPSSGANNTAIYHSSTNPTHIYTTPGKHYITLQVFAGPCPSNVFTDSVYVSPNPIASFKTASVCVPKGQSTFINTSDTATGFVPYSYVWNFGQPASLANDSSYTKDGVHSYDSAQAGGYTVSLKVTNRFGCVGNSTQTVSSIYQTPTASFTSKAIACKDDVVTLTSTSTISNDQTISSFYWDYGDGKDSSSTSSSTITHKYDSVGKLTVRLAITSFPGGCLSDTVSQTISIHPLPVPSFILPSNCLVQGQPVTFTDNSTIENTYPIPPDNIVKWSWNFGDTSNTVGSNLQNGQHTFTSHNPGTYNVIETDTTSSGCYASDTIAYIIDGSKPIPGFEIVSSQLCSNLPIQIIDTSRIGVGKITEVQIVWDVLNNPSIISTDNTPSNGATGSSKTYSNTYPDSTINETYTIKLIASTGGSTCLDSISKNITVFGRPIVTFTASPSSICANASPVVFTGATETNGPTGVFSYSGAGVSNSSFNPAKASVGSNTIQAMFTTANGCKDSANSTITVLPVDNISFNLKPDTLQVCKTDIITLNPSSNSQSYYWSESDSLLRNTFVASKTTKSTQVLPVDDSTIYYVTANASSCPTSDSVKIYASPYPNVSIVSPIHLDINNIHDTTICYNGTATLTAATTDNAAFVWLPSTTLSDNTAASTAATPLDSTEYIVTATGSKYCGKQVYDTAIVKVLKPFNIGTRVGNDTALNVVPGESIRLHAFVLDTSFHTPLAYSWSPNTYLDIADTSSPLLTPNTTFGGSNQSQLYRVTATTAQGCPADTTITIHFYNLIDIYVPTAFNPNSNNPKNRVLTAVPVGITQFQFFRVFNRYGQLVFSTTQLGNGWDGTILGISADIGTYIWESQGLDYNNKLVKRTGTVVLIR